MARLHVSLLGPFQVTLDGEPVTAFESNKVRALLAYLAVEADRPHQRGKLAGLLWPERPERAARRNLRDALSNLRKAVRDRAQPQSHTASAPFLLVSRQTIQFNGDSDAFVDVATFTRLLEAPAQTADALEEAVDLYRGEFLEGFPASVSLPFEEWALLKQEQLNRQALETLHRLAAIYEERGEYTRALPHAWRQVELEPWHEKAHRQLIRLLALNGQRSAALTQYEICLRALLEQLGVEPSPETTRLYEQIRDGKATRPPPRAAPSAAVGPGLPTSPPLARRRPPWLPTGGKLALLAGALLLMMIVGAAAVFLATREWLARENAETFHQPTFIEAPIPGSKVVESCDDQSPSQICVYDARTGQRLLLTEKLEFEMVGARNWSPDGERIVFSAGSDFRYADRPDEKLYTINADGSDLKQITDSDTNDISPVWSPDGEWIAFHRDGALWLVHPDGTAAHLLFEQERFAVGSIGWSPDGQQIAFMLENADPSPSHYEIWMINRDGTDPKMVHSFEQPLTGESLTWDPEGEHIACHCVFDSGESKNLLFNSNGAGDEPLRIDMLPYLWFPNFWPQWGEVE